MVAIPIKNVISTVAFLLLILQVYPQQGLIKYISFENSLLLPDLRLEDNGIRYSVAISGSNNNALISSESFNGNKSILYECPASSVTQRFEHKLLNTGDTNGLNFSNERYIGFAIKIPDSFETPTNSIIFCQAWQGDPYGPVAMLKFMPGNSDPFRIKCNIRNTVTGTNSSDPDSSLWQGYVDRNKWYSFVWYIKPRQNGDSGLIKLWINNSLKLSWNGNVGYLPESQGGPAGAYNDLVVKFGIYQPGGNTAHKLFFDEIKASDSYEEAIPFSEDTVQKKTCLSSNVNLYSGYINNTNTYQWQIDTGNGFQNILNNEIYQGVNEGTLKLLNPPSSLYGASYKCISPNQVGILYTLKFAAIWRGSSDASWDNPSNWNCDIIPDSNTDVLIPSGQTYSPFINSIARCRSISLSPLSSITIAENAHLVVTH